MTELERIGDLEFEAMLLCDSNEGTHALRSNRAHIIHWAELARRGRKNLPWGTLELAIKSLREYDASKT